MMISWIKPVNPSHPYLENDPGPSFDPHHLRLSAGEGSKGPRLYDWGWMPIGPWSEPDQGHFTLALGGFIPLTVPEVRR